jgi:hypothetical protein
MAAATIKAAKATKGKGAFTRVAGGKPQVRTADETIKALKASQNHNQTDGKPTLDNCYRDGSAYANSLRALRSLGINRMHAFDKAVAEVRKQMGPAAWKEFAAKKGCEDAVKRATVNFGTIARAKDYGKPIVLAGYSVRYDGRAKQVGLFKNGK